MESSNPATAHQVKELTLPPGPDLDLLIVGKSGNGKSSTGNSILGKDHFEIFYDADVEVRQCGFGETVKDGRTIRVWDAPGFCDAVRDVMPSYEETLDVLRAGIGSNARGGFDAILLTLQLGSRMTAEEMRALQDLKEMLGDDVVRDHCVIVFTGGDTLAGRTKDKVTFQEWSQAQTGHLQTILQECEYRCLLFNNVTDDEGILRRQRYELIRSIDHLPSSRDRMGPLKNFTRFLGTRSRTEEEARHDPGISEEKYRQGAGVEPQGAGMKNEGKTPGETGSTHLTKNNRGVNQTQEKNIFATAFHALLSFLRNVFG